MATNIKLRNLLWSTGLFFLWEVLFILISVRGNNPLGWSFSIFVWVTLTGYITIGSSILLLILRVCRLIRKPTNFFYTFAGIANVMIALFVLALFVARYAKHIEGSQYVPQLLAGSIILCDIYLFNGSD